MSADAPRAVAAAGLPGPSLGRRRSSVDSSGILSQLEQGVLAERRKTGRRLSSSLTEGMGLGPTLVIPPKGPSGLSAAEEAKASASDTAKRIEMAAIEAARGSARDARGSVAGAPSYTRIDTSATAQPRPPAAEATGGRTEAEAIKHRASEFARELAARVERETAMQRRGGGGHGRPSAVVATSKKGNRSTPNQAVPIRSDGHQRQPTKNKVDINETPGDRTSGSSRCVEAQSAAVHLH